MKRVGGPRKHPYPPQNMVQAWFVYFDNGPQLDHGLLWRQRCGPKHAYSRAGCRTAARTGRHPDRWLVKFQGAMYNVRDLIWIYHCGKMPEGGLKFKDGNHWNLRIENIVSRDPVVSFL